MHMDSRMILDIFLPAAELYVREDRAYLLRLGINPQVRQSVSKYCNKGGIEGPAGPAIIIPLFLAMCNARALFLRIIEPHPYIM